MSDGDGPRWRPSLSVDRQALLNLAFIAAVFCAAALPVTAAVIAGSGTPVQGEITITTNNGPQVDWQEPSDGEVDFRAEMFPDDNTVVWNSTAGNMTVSSVGRTDATVNVITGAWTRTSAIETNGRALTLNPEDKAHVVVDGGVTAVDFRPASAVQAGDSSVDFRYAADSSGTVQVTGLQPNTQYAGTTGTGKNLGGFTTDGSGRGTVPVVQSAETEAFIYETSPPAIDSASPADGANLESDDAELSATVSDPDFVTSSGDTVTVTFYLNGNQVQQTPISSNQTVTADVQPPLGQQSTWHVEVEDNYGNTDSIAQRTFNTPADLRIYQESQPTQLVDDVNLTVRFFPLQEGGQVVTRTTDSGVLNMTGLPADERFAVTVSNDTDGYVYRRVVVDSLYETNEVYLLNESVESSQVVFELQDPTGTFPPSSTILYVEKPITKNGTTEYKTVAGDVFGASSRFPAILQDDTRYRLRVATADGEDERMLGYYTVYGNAVEPLKIQRIEPSADVNETGVVYGGLQGEGNNTQLAVRFRGGESDTTVEYNVTDSSGTIIVPTTTTTASRFAHVYPVDPDGSYTVAYTITYADGSTQTGSFVAGDVGGIAGRFDIDAQVMSLLSWLLIVASMGLVVIINPKLAPIAGSGMATALTLIGTVAIPGPMLGIAGAISVLALFGGDQ